MSQSWFFNFNILCGTSDSNNLNDLIKGIWEESDNEKPIKQIDWDSVSRLHLSSSNFTNSSVCSEDHNWSEVRLKGSIKVSKALNIEHVHLIDE
jgi:hypothetical protein